MSSTEATRPEFEAAFRAQFDPPGAAWLTQRDARGEYLEREVESAWIGWKLAVDAQRVQVAAPRQSANVARALAMVDAGTHTALEAARAAGVSPSTVYRVIAARRASKGS